jgi:hypothetical protein
MYILNIYKKIAIRILIEFLFIIIFKFFSYFILFWILTLRYL